MRYSFFFFSFQASITSSLMEYALALFPICGVGVVLSVFATAELLGGLVNWSGSGAGGTGGRAGRGIFGGGAAKAGTAVETVRRMGRRGLSTVRGGGDMAVS